MWDVWDVGCGMLASFPVSVRWFAAAKTILNLESKDG